MERKRWFVFIAALLVGMFIALSPIETIAEVQNNALQTLSQEEVAERRSEIFGITCCAILQIPASSFVPRGSAITYGYFDSAIWNHYYRSRWSPTLGYCNIAIGCDNQIP